MDFDKVAEKVLSFNYRPTGYEMLLEDDAGWTIAHLMASKGRLSQESEFLTLVDENDWSVAHQMAKNMQLTKDFGHWLLKDKHDNTVLHVAASNGHLWPSATKAQVSYICSEKNDEGKTPWECHLAYGAKRFDEMRAILKR